MEGVYTEPYWKSRGGGLWYTRIAAKRPSGPERDQAPEEYMVVVRVDCLCGLVVGIGMVCEGWGECERRASDGQGENSCAAFHIFEWGVLTHTAHTDTLYLPSRESSAFDLDNLNKVIVTLFGLLSTAWVGEVIYIEQTQNALYLSSTHLLFSFVESKPNYNGFQMNVCLSLLCMSGRDASKLCESVQYNPHSSIIPAFANNTNLFHQIALNCRLLCVPMVKGSIHSGT